MKKHYSKRNEKLYNKLCKVHTEYKNITATPYFSWTQDTVVEMNCVHCGKLHERELGELDVAFQCSCQDYKILITERAAERKATDNDKPKKPTTRLINTAGYIYYMQQREQLKE